MSKNYYILFLFVFITFFASGQTSEQSIEELSGSIENGTFDEDQYINDGYSAPQQDYLSSPIEIKKFDREKWNRIKRKVVDDYVGEEENYGADSPYGQEKLNNQDNPYQRSEQNYQKYWDGKQKNSKEIKTRPKERTETSIQPRDSPSGSSGGLSISPVFGYLLLIIAIAALVILIFYLFFKTPIEKKTKKIKQDIGDISPTEIPKTELELMLEKSLIKEDYREAIRIYFIFILRALSKKNWINWEKEKTNFSYLLEMRKNKFYNEFETSVSIYELVWYGKRALDKEMYLSLEPKFKELTKELEKQ
jgi:hypothetical protein